MSDTLTPQQRWAQRHPERAAALNRRRAAKLAEADRRLRARHPDGYEALRAAQDATDAPAHVKRRRAAQALRRQHPDDWREIRAAVREDFAT